MSTGVEERVHKSSPLTQAVAEAIGISRMIRLGGIDLMRLHRYFQSPKKKDLAIPDDAEVIAILIPGFSGPGTTMDWLAQRLTRDKVYAMTWGDHTNFGPFPHIVDHLYELIKDVSEHTNKKVVLIGHSLGGVYALHANRLFPEYVEGAITLGSPCETTLEGLAEATVLGKAAQLLANEYVHVILHKEMILNWGPESSKDNPQGWRFAVAASLDNIVDAFSTLLEDDERTRSVIVKSDHCGLPTNGLIARMVDTVIRTGDVHVDFSDSINKRLLTRDDLHKVNGLPQYVKVLNHMTRGHRHRMKILHGVVDNARDAGQELLINAPKNALDLLTRPLLDPQGATNNARVILPEGVVHLDDARQLLRQPVIPMPAVAHR